MFDKQKILENITKPDEKLFYAKALDQAYSCLKKFEPCFTEFSNPYNITEFIKLFDIGQSLNIKVFGGFDEAERQIIGFSPDYEELTEDDFPISVIKITYDIRYSKKLTHRDFLGSILGLGIVREKIGDILTFENEAFIFVKSDIADFIYYNLERIGHTKVKIELSNKDAVPIAINTYEEKKLTVSSLRLDTVLSAAFNLSRGKTAELIKSEKAFVNWGLVTSVSKNTEALDIITLRGLGRIKIKEILGKTKKDKYLINIIKYK